MTGKDAIGLDHVAFENINVFRFSDFWVQIVPFFYI